MISCLVRMTSAHSNPIATRWHYNVDDVIAENSSHHVVRRANNA